MIIKNNKGATLIEVVLIIFLFTILLASAASLVSTTTSREDLKSKAREVTDFISRAHNYAVTSYFGDDWGVKVLDEDTDCDDEGDSIKDCIIIFKGNDYDTRDKGYDEKVEFLTEVYIESSEENEFYFKYSSGLMSTNVEQGITLTNIYGDNKYVTSTALGLVYYGD